MKSIESLDELVEKLKQTQAEDYVSVAKNLDIPISDFEDYEYWLEDRYARNCIARTDDFELILLCWEKGQGSPIHCHGGQKCWVYQLYGEVEEVRYKKNSSQELVVDNKQVLAPGKLSYMDDNMGYHALENNSSTRAMSLHLYMKPIDSCTVYKDNKDKFESVDLNYDTIERNEIKISA